MSGTGSSATLALTPDPSFWEPLPDSSGNLAYSPLPGSHFNTLTDDHDLDALLDNYRFNNPNDIQDFTTLFADHPGLGIPAANAAAPDHTFVVDPIPCLRRDSTRVLAEQDATPLVCTYPQCSRTKPFNRKFDLDRHMKSHGPREFGCPVHGCKRQGDKGFPRKDKLRDHVRQKHGMKLSDFEPLMGF